MVDVKLIVDGFPSASMPNILQGDIGHNLRTALSSSISSSHQHQNLTLPHHRIAVPSSKQSYDIRKSHPPDNRAIAPLALSYHRKGYYAGGDAGDEPGTVVQLQLQKSTVDRRF